MSCQNLNDLIKLNITDTSTALKEHRLILSLLLRSIFLENLPSNGSISPGPQNCSLKHSSQL